jgi:hypothetical protein
MNKLLPASPVSGGPGIPALPVSRDKPNPCPDAPADLLLTRNLPVNIGGTSSDDFIGIEDLLAQAYEDDVYAMLIRG